MFFTGVPHHANIVHPEGVTRDPIDSPGSSQPGTAKLPQVLHVLLPLQDGRVGLAGNSVNNLESTLLAKKMKNYINE